jgi:hypothetical protein
LDVFEDTEILFSSIGGRGHAISIVFNTDLCSTLRFLRCTIRSTSLRFLRMHSQRNMNGMAKYLVGVPLCFFMVGAQRWWRYGGNFAGRSCGRPRRPALAGDAVGQRCSPLRVHLLSRRGRRESYSGNVASLRQRCSFLRRQGPKIVSRGGAWRGGRVRQDGRSGCGGARGGRERRRGEDDWWVSGPVRVCQLNYFLL